MSNNEMREIQPQQDELSRKLTEKISDDLSKFQKNYVSLLHAFESSDTVNS
jgi:hypothetical protein